MSVNSGYVYRDRVKERDEGVTVLEYHVRRFPHADLERWRRLIAGGSVCIGERVARADERLRAGDELTFRREPWVEPAAPLEFRVVFEDEHVLVVEKPSGLQVLPAGSFLESTLLALVRRSDPSRRDCAPVHRLGRGTSGLVLFGRTSAARAALSKQFRRCTLTKTYLALARGCDLPTSIIARQPIGPVPHGPMKLHVATPAGKPSVTRLRVLRRDRAADRSLVAAQPITGRPDQIRIHLAACGAPIVGDPLFGPGGVAVSDARPGEGGYFLHATSLLFAHPADGRVVKLRSFPAWA